MARGRCTFRQRDVTAAIKAVRKAGESVARIEVGPEGVTVITGTPEPPAPEPGGLTEEDRERFRDALRSKKPGARKAP